VLETVKSHCDTKVIQMVSKDLFFRFTLHR